MYRPQRNRPTPSNNAARLAAEAAFSAPPIERMPEPVSNALIVVKKKRLFDPIADASDGREAHDDETHHAPRVFRLPSVESAVEEKSSAANDEPPPRDVVRRVRRSSVMRPSPVVTVQMAPASPPVDLAELARELEAAMTAREHAAAEAQLNRLQAQLSALDSVLALIAKARDFTLSDMQLSNQWQQLTQAAGRLLDGPHVGRLTPQS